MKMVKLFLKDKIFITLLMVLLAACYEDKSVNSDSKIPEITNVESFKGNAFVFFTNPNLLVDHVYILPSNIEDSVVFKNVNVNEVIQNKVSIQMRIGLNNMQRLMTDKNKEIMASHPCNLPQDSMLYSRVYIEYKNYKEVLIHRDEKGKLIKVDKDSCNTRLISHIDSAEFIKLHIY